MSVKGSQESPASMHMVERQMILNRVRDQANPPEHGVEDAGPYRFITIARNVGAFGDAVAAGLAAHLNWHVFDKEIVDFIAADSHVRQDLVRKLDERSQSLIQDTVERLLLMVSGVSFGNEEYHEALLKTLAYIAARGRAIIVGRGGAYGLQGEPGLHVRLVAPPDVRMMRLAERWQVTPEEAKRRMQQIDIERSGFIHRHFHQNSEDLRFYHAVFDTYRLSVEQIVQSVLGLMQLPAQVSDTDAAKRHHDRPPRAQEARPVSR